MRALPFTKSSRIARFQNNLTPYQLDFQPLHWTKQALVAQDPFIPTHVGAPFSISFPFSNRYVCRITRKRSHCAMYDCLLPYAARRLNN